MAATSAAVGHHYAKKDAQASASAQQQADAEQAAMDQAYQQGAADAQAAAQQAAPPPPAAAPQPAPGSDLTSQLQQLAQLHNAGVLNDEEFAAAKAKLLSGG
jgi:hypothetical protein